MKVYVSWGKLILNCDTDTSWITKQGDQNNRAKSYITGCVLVFYKIV